MSNSTNAWFGQVTTGTGFMLLAPTLLAALSGTMSWSAAFPLLVAAAVGLVWPENTGLKDAAQTAAADLEKVYAKYQSNVVAAASNAPMPPDPRKTSASFAILAAIGLSLTACAGQTPALQAAEMRAIECIAGTTARVAAATADPASGAMKVANAATAAERELSTDTSCAAVTAGTPAPAKP